MRRILLVSLLLFATALFAQTVVPSGTILPLRLNSSLKSNKIKPGHVVTARVMQDVPLSDKSKIPTGSKVIGHIVEVSPSNSAGGAKIALRFDTLVFSKQRVAITTDARALASMMTVFAAQLPELGGDRGTPENAWVTEQIGGEANYHGGWDVTNGSQVVGKSLLSGGVLARVSAAPGSKCRGEIENNHELQPFWVFASDACGTYGFEDLTIAHAGRTNPIGEIVLTAQQGNVHIPRGSGLLLRVIKGDK
jgi:hypothetical protein